MKNFIKQNYLIISYIAIAIFLEVFSLVAMGFYPWILKPFTALLLLWIATYILLIIKNHTARFWTAFGFMTVQGVINLVCIVVYEMTGTAFDYGMLKLRKDAMGILENIPINFTYLFAFMLIVVAFLVFAKRGIKYLEPIKTKKRDWAMKSLALALLFPTCLTMINTTCSLGDSNDYTKKLYMNSQDKYQEVGVIANGLNEFYKMLFSGKVKLGDKEELAQFVYAEENDKTQYFGVSEGNNVVTILVESFEWYPLIIDAEKYPNALTSKYFTQEALEELYPNIFRVIDEGVTLKNNYAREKTDISENDSIVGSYPTQAYINYDFPTNTNPFTAVNMVKAIDPTVVANSFHNGYTTYYNRNQAHLALGFEKFHGEKELREMGNGAMYAWDDEGERNLDSEMIMAGKDKMFLTDQRFYTYITTISMHGMYSERQNLQEHYQKLKEKMSCNFDSLNDDQKRVFYYMGCVKEFDKALGLIFEDLEAKSLLDTTTIAMFGDHNTYYQGLSNYVKDTYSSDHKNYTNLYNVPMFIYDQKLATAIEANGEGRVIDKFTTTYDLVPTLLDLLGIRYFSNLYFGHSVFSSQESILYSRAYNIFMNDKLYLYSMNNILYKGEGADIKGFETEAKTLLTKLSHIDRIFYNDYFAMGDNAQIFKDKLLELQTR